MTTDHGVSYCIHRLGSCPDLAGLQRVWGNLGIAYQMHPTVLATKDRLEAQFQKEARA